MCCHRAIVYAFKRSKGWVETVKVELLGMLPVRVREYNGRAARQVGRRVADGGQSGSGADHNGSGSAAGAYFQAPAPQLARASL